MSVNRKIKGGVAELEAAISRCTESIKMFRNAIEVQRSVQLDCLRSLLEGMGVSWDEVTSRSRASGKGFYARCLISRHMHDTGYPLSAIAGVFNRRHSTVAYYLRCYRSVVDEPRRDRAFADFIAEFDRRMLSGE